MDTIKINEFGYSEMYEWNVTPENELKYGKFVSFSKENPSKIEFYNSSKHDDVLGIATINAVCVSDNPEEWPKKYLMNEVGDLFLTNEVLSVGERVYDEGLELSFIRTKKWEHLIKITNKAYNNDNNYVKRSQRQEWTRVSLLGKTIVKDNGKCVPGEYCMPYVGKVTKNLGTAVPATEDAKHKYYVIERLSENSILILNK